MNKLEFTVKVALPRGITKDEVIGMVVRKVGEAYDRAVKTKFRKFVNTNQSGPPKQTKRKDAR